MGLHTEALDLAYHGMPKPGEPIDGPLPMFYFGAGYVLRIMELRTGEAVRMHQHTYDHWSHIIVGRGRLITDDALSHVRMGGLIYIKAGSRHAFIADEPTIWVCVHKEGEEPDEDWK